MWWILQILGIVCVSGALTFARWYGLAYTGILTPWAVKVSIEFVAAFLFIKSYAIAPTFLQPWFLGTACLSLFGFVASFLIFHDIVTITHWIGCALCIIGGVLLVL